MSSAGHKRKIVDKAILQQPATRQAPLYQKGIVGRDSNPHKYSTNSVEDSMIAAIDMRRQLEKIAPILEKLEKGLIDLPQAFQQTSGMAFMRLLEFITNRDTSEKVAADASKHLLALAGFTAIQKHAIATVDAGQSKDALLALIAGSKDALLEEGIEIEDDRSKDPAEDK